MKALKTKRRFVLLCVLTVLLALIIWTAWGNTALMVNTIRRSYGHFRIYLYRH